MKIPKNLPNPGRVAGQIAKNVGAAASRAGGEVGPRSKAGLGSRAAAPATSSTAGIMVQALMTMHRSSVADAKASRAASHEASSSKIDAKRDQRGQTAKKQEAERNAAWTNVAYAVAGATASAASGAAGAVTGATAAHSPLSHLAIGQRKALVDTIEAVRSGATEAAGKAFEGVANGLAETDINGLVQHVVRESYLETNKDLAFYADKVKHFNDVKQSIRDELTRAREARADLPSLEEKLQTVGEDAQLANVDLQNHLQKQQQTLQMMSQIAKTLQNTAMTVIRKIGG